MKKHQKLLLEVGVKHRIEVRYRNRFGRNRVYQARFEGVVPYLQRRHQEAESEWGEVIPCYTHVINDSHQSTFEDQLLNSDIILWSSRIQFEHYLAKYPQLKSREHASGLGKTFMALKEKVPKLIPCLDYQHLLEKTQEK